MRRTAFPGPEWADVVFTGAGVSMAPPTRLPSGAQLGAIAWQALRESLPEYERNLRHTADAITTPTAFETGGLRLEHLMNLIGTVRHDRPLVEVYDLVRGGEPNALHRTIAALPARVATVNMDLLHEKADEGRESVLHLHGDVEHEDQISTTIEQYLSGVPAELADPFIGAIAGKRVLVIGWGARDLDIVELFLRRPPAALHFIEHGDRAPEDEALSGPALAFLKRVEDAATEGTATEVTWQQAEAVVVLNQTRGREAEHDAATQDAGIPDPAWSVPERAAEALTGLPEAERVAAANRVLFETGEHRAVIEMAELASRRGVSTDAIRTQRGRALRKQGRPGAALRAFVQPAGLSDVGRPLRHPNELSALLAALGVPLLPTALDRFLVARAVQRREPMRELLPLARRMQLLNVHGRVRDTAFAAERVWRLGNTLGPLGLGNQIDAITWAADALKLQGRYPEAIHRLGEAADRIPYTNPSQSAWALWKLAELQLLAGDPADALRTLDQAQVDIVRAGEPALEFWALCTRADAERVADARTARRHLQEAAELHVREAAAHAYFRLIAASIDAAAGRHDEASRHVRLVKRLARSRVRPLASALVSARLIEAASAAKPDRSAVRRIAQRSYRLGFDGGGQRATWLLVAIENDEPLDRFLDLPILM